MASNFFMQMFSVSTLCMHSYQMASVKALVQVDFLVYAPSEHKQNPYMY